MLGVLRIVAILLVCLGAFTPARASVTQPPPPAATAETVEVGLYVISVYDLDHGASSYLMNFYMWLKWKGDIDPSKSLEFTNMVDKSSATIDYESEEPRILADGTRYRFMRVEGRFTDPSSFHNYPFDIHNLSIRIEDFKYGTRELVYKLSPESSYSKDLNIPGWDITRLESTVAARAYNTTFGVDDPSQRYSNATFSLVIERPAAIFYWKLMLPLAFIVFAGLAALILPSGEFDARSALLAGALLTTVFLQKTYSDMLPNVGYLVLMDKIYVIAYVVIFAGLIRAIYSHIRLLGLPDSAEAGTWRVDRMLFIALGLFFSGASAYLVLFR